MTEQQDLTGEVSVENKDIGDISANSVSIRAGNAKNVNATTVDITLGGADRVEAGAGLALVEDALALRKPHQSGHRHQPLEAPRGDGRQQPAVCEDFGNGDAHTSA